MPMLNRAKASGSYPAFYLMKRCEHV